MTSTTAIPESAYAQEWQWLWMSACLSLAKRELGAPDKIIQRILRHASVAVTQSCYLKTPDGEVTRAMQQFERFLEYATICTSRGTRGSM